MRPYPKRKTSSSYTGFGVEDPHVSRSPSPLSTSWTPTEPVLIHQAPTVVTANQPFTTALARCLLCQRLNCRLRSHQDYVSAREGRSRKLTLQDPGHDNLANAKPKEVADDQAIRNTFTQSYAFVGPSHLKLSVLQPSGFRLDVFHDLPVSNGDRPEPHRLIWNFLGRFTTPLLTVLLTQATNTIELHCACLAVAMTNPSVCLCMLATEKMVQTSQDKRQTRSIPKLMQSFQKSLKSVQQEPFDGSTLQHVAEGVLSLCMRVVSALHRQTSSTAPLSTTDQDRWEFCASNIKLLTAGDEEG